MWSLVDNQKKALGGKVDDVESIVDVVQVT